MKRISVTLNDELLAALESFAKRHKWSREKAASELLWRAIRLDMRREAVRPKLQQKDTA